MVDDSMPPANLMLQALHAIRAEIKLTNAQLGETNSRLDRLEHGLAENTATIAATNARLDTLSGRVTEGFLHTNTNLVDLGRTVDHLADKLDTHEKRVDHLLTDGLGAEVRLLGKRVLRLESARVVRRPTKK